MRELEINAGADPGTWLPLNELVWSCIWLSDIERLADLTSSFEKDPSHIFQILYATFSLTELGALWTGQRSTSSTPKSGPSTPTNPRVETTPSKSAPSPCRKRRRIESSSPRSDPTTTRSSSKKVTELCRKRDKTCVLTKATEPTNACHIIPYSLGHRRLHQITYFWRTLSLFWDQSKISELQDFVTQKSTETTENLLLLAPHVHAYWDKQLFALQPLSISNDKKSLTVKFFWLCPSSLDSLRLSTAALPEDPSQEFTVEPPSFPANLGQGGRECVYGERPNIRLFNCEANELISSGQVITLTTEDPESLPLPDLKLLDLQWKLHRVLALVAAAGYNEDEDENYDDDDRYGREPVIVSGEEDSLDEYEKPWAKKPFESHTSTTAMGII